MYFTEARSLQISNLYHSTESQLCRLHARRHIASTPHALRTIQTENDYSWPSKKVDFKVIDEVMTYLTELLHATQRNPDWGSIVPSLKEKLLQSPLMASLNSKDLKVSPEQNGKRPLQHSLDVLVAGTLKDMPLHWQVGLIFCYLFHDVGKNWGASGKESSHHSWVSGLILRPYIFQYFKPYGEEFCYSILHAIDYHHTSFEVVKGLIDESELQRRFSHTLSSIFLYLLTIADMTSVPAHQGNIPAVHELVRRVRPDVADLFFTENLKIGKPISIPA